MMIVKRYPRIFAFLFLTIAYFASRLYNILSLPLFTDEAIYVRWSQIARYDASWRFISLTDGKQPSFVWATMSIMRFVSDPLLAGRLTSVFAGFAGLIGIYVLAVELFRSKRVGFMASILFLVYPFALVYDRMALYDSLVTAFAIWSLYFLIRLAKSTRLDVALILGMVLGGGVLTKSSAFLSIYLSPVILLLFNFSQKDWTKKLLRWAILMLIASALAYGYYSILRLSPYFHIIGQKNEVFIYPLKEWLQHPFRFVIGNLKGLLDWLIGYMTYPVMGLVLVSFFVNPFKHIKEKVFLFLWFILPFVALAVFAKLLYPRFIYFMTIPLIILASYSLYSFYERFKNVFSRVVLILLFLALPLRADFFILKDLSHAPIPGADLEQYIDGWPAGGGVKEVISYLSDQSKKGKIFVLSTGTFGSLPTYAVEIYLGDDKNVDKKGIYPVPQKIPDDIYEKAKTMPVYVFTSNQMEFDIAVRAWPIKELVSYRKGVGDSYSRLYRVEAR